VMNWVMLFTSFKLASISIATAVYHTQPLFLLIISAIAFNEAIPLNKVVWIIVAFVGVLLTIDVDVSTFSFASDYAAGLLLAIGAAFLYAAATMVAKRLKGIRSHIIALVQLTSGVVMLAPLADFSAVPAINGVQWSYLVILGGVHT